MCCATRERMCGNGVQGGLLPIEITFPNYLPNLHITHAHLSRLALPACSESRDRTLVINEISFIFGD